MRPVAATSILLLLSGGITVAQADPPTPAQIASRPTAAEPCNGLYEKYCSAVPSGAGRKLICMTHHLPQLTPACRERIQNVYKLESELAAKDHMTVPQFMAWGQGIQEQAVKTKKGYKSYKMKAADQTPAPAAQPQPPAPSKPQPQ
jgi:hypothetical protein